MRSTPIGTPVVRSPSSWDLEPGHDLKDLERRILSQDPSLAAPSDPELSPTAHRRRPSRRALVLLGALAAAATAAVTIAVLELTDAETNAPIVAQANSVAVIDPATNAVVDASRWESARRESPPTATTSGCSFPTGATVSHLSGSERTLLGTVGAGNTASGLAAEDRGVWVSDARTGRVTLIERERLTVAATARAGGRPLVGPYTDAGLLAMGFGSLWFASGKQTISRIDPRTGRVTARIRQVPTGESDGAITTGVGSVWVAGPVQGSPLTRIDPSRNAVLARIALSKFRSGGATVAGGNVWVADPGGDKVWRVDPMRNVPVSTTDVGAAPIGVASGHGSVWVANAGDGTVSRIDPVTGPGHPHDRGGWKPERTRRHRRRGLGDGRLGGGLRRQARVHTLYSGEELLLARPDARRGELLGRQQHPRELGHARCLDPVDLRDHAVEREEFRVGDEGLAEPAHTARRRLHRENDAALEILLRAFELGLADVAGGDVGDLLGDDGEARIEVLLPRPDVDADLAGVRVLAGEVYTAYAMPRFSRISWKSRDDAEPPRMASRMEAANRLRSEREIPVAPRQTWYCSVSFRWKRSPGGGCFTSGLRTDAPACGGSTRW